MITNDQPKGLLGLMSRAEDKGNTSRLWLTGCHGKCIV